MTSALNQDGQITLPASLRERLGLAPGDEVEMDVGDEEAIILRKSSRRTNKGLVELLLACPYPLEVPPRSREVPPPPIEF